METKAPNLRIVTITLQEYIMKFVFSILFVIGSFTAMAQDALETQERLDRADLSQRPKVRFNQFRGEPESFDVFERDISTVDQGDLRTPSTI